MSKNTIHQQSGAVPYFIRNNQIHYILITSTGGNWIFPKGDIEPFMQPWESALYEAKEEAGVHGIISTHVIASYKNEKFGGLYRIDMYLLKVTEIYDSWDEDIYRGRKICTLEQAKQIIHKRVYNVLIQASKVIKSNFSNK